MSEAPTELPLLRLSDGLPPLVDTPAELAETIAALANAEGPVAIDAERASGFRYSARAYLIQIRRAGAGTHLIDTGVLTDLSGLAAAIDDAEWILHAANQDLPCLRDVGLQATKLFDTELAARLLGYPRVGLATLVSVICGQTMRKEHSASDWSIRPLPHDWLEYAALDVEVLDVIREHLIADLEKSGKTEWARQEFEHLLGFEPTVRAEPWRRTSQIQRVRSRRALAATRELWLARDQLARERDVAAGRLLPDSSIVAAAKALPTSRRALLGTPGFQGRAAKPHAQLWVDAIAKAASLPDTALPVPNPRGDGPPPPRVWADKHPAAAARLDYARNAIAALSVELSVPVENMMTPDTVRRVMWQPPAEGESLHEILADYAAREWQIELLSPVLEAAIEAGAGI